VDLAVGVAGGKQAALLGLAALVQPLGGNHEQLADAVERVVAATPMAEGVLLDAPAGAVHDPVPGGHDVERIGHSGGIG
jgi:hypothetical protein